LDKQDIEDFFFSYKNFIICEKIIMKNKKFSIAKIFELFKVIIRDYNVSTQNLFVSNFWNKLLDVLSCPKSENLDLQREAANLFSQFPDRIFDDVRNERPVRLYH
jgi:hypothetical protein